jgi:pimeloyl-ACP methyl ester carboxylesterase
MTGILKDWSVIPKLSAVSCPTLILNGADDEVPDSCVAPLFHGIKRARWVTFGLSSHMAFWEEPEKYFQIVGDFLAESSLEGGAGAPGVVARWFYNLWFSLFKN